MSAAERARAQAPQSGLVRFVDIPERLHRLFYDTACVTGLGFLFHGLFDTAYSPLFDSNFLAAWEAYVEVNRRYAGSVSRDGLDGPILVEDYHLMALACQLRSMSPAFSRTVAYFHHVPWCPPAVFRLLPGALRRDVLAWLLAFDTVGFHARAWADQFIACCDAFLDDVRCDPDTVRWRGRDVRVVVAPAQIGVGALRAAREAEPVGAAQASVERWAEGCPLLVRVDRVDLWKNIVRGFVAFEEYARANRGRGKDVRFVAVLATSRMHLEPYWRYFEACRTEAERVNQALTGRSDGPIRLIVNANRHWVLACLAAASAVLANSTSDGLNIVPKEAVVAGQGRARLVLSENMGVFEEIGRWAIGVDPFDIGQTAEAIGVALGTAGNAGQAELRQAELRQAELRAAVERNDPRRWVGRRLGLGESEW